MKLSWTVYTTKFRNRVCTLFLSALRYSFHTATTYLRVYAWDQKLMSFAGRGKSKEKRLDICCKI
jgi:hypothetical protein